MQWGPALVHVFTSLGAVCALFAARSVAGLDAQGVFFWLFVAFVIDAIDGTFARAVNVAERLPRFSGERLDLVVDYLTYVFVPVLALMAWRYLDGMIGIFLAAGILLSSLFHFSDLESKTKDNCFVGFPAVWNIVAFYVFALNLSVWLTEVIAALAITLAFIPMPWVHPLRVVSLRWVTLAATAVFTIAGLASLWHGFPAPIWAQVCLVAVAAYFVGLSALWWWRGLRRNMDHRDADT